MVGSTAKAMTYLHYRSGPFEETTGPRRADGTPFIPPWDWSGDDVRLTETSFGERDNWLPPGDWPRACRSCPIHRAVR